MKPEPYKIYAVKLYASLPCPLEHQIISFFQERGIDDITIDYASRTSFIAGKTFLLEYDDQGKLQFVRNKNKIAYVRANLTRLLSLDLLSYGIEFCITFRGYRLKNESYIYCRPQYDLYYISVLSEQELEQDFERYMEKFNVITCSRGRKENVQAFYLLIPFSWKEVKREYDRYKYEIPVKVML